MMPFGSVPLATASLALQSVISATGWTGATLANLQSSDNLRATGGTLGEFIELSLADVPAGFGSANTIVLAVEWAITGNANRAKSLLVELRSSTAAILASFITPSRASGTADAVDTSAALNISTLTAADLNGAVLRITVQEAGGMSDTVSVTIDQIVAPVLDYNIQSQAAVATPNGVGATTGLGTLSVVGQAVTSPSGVQISATSGVAVAQTGLSAEVEVSGVELVLIPGIIRGIL